MSSYNDNLHSSVVDSLQTQELDLKKVKAKKNASMFTLYYAEGATITASEQLAKATSKLSDKTDVKNQAVADSNISNNLLKSSTQSDQYIKQSVTNASVCAANVQVAANAVVRLASDLGSIYSIVHAADAGTELYVLANQARSLIDTTAYNAELASQGAMEVSMLTSEVSSSTVLDKTKSTSTFMNNLLKVATDDFNTASQLVASDNATLASVSATEKLSEGDYEDISVDLKAAQEAYKATNDGLNLGLTATVTTAENFTVEFFRIRAPFNQVPGNYPVEKYTLFLVKDSKKGVFSLATAENLLLTGRKDSSTTPPSAATTATGAATTAGTGSSAQPQASTVQYVPVISVQDISQVATPGELLNVITQAVDIQHVIVPGAPDPSYVLYDTDNEPIKLGSRYVVFVMAEYTSAYKKLLNDYSEFLSAPTAPFVFTNQLAAIAVSDITTASGSADFPVSFVSYESEFFLPSVEYRCIFLPAYANFSGNLLNQTSLKVLDNDVDALEQIALTYDPAILNLQEQIASLTSLLAPLNTQLDALKKTAKKSPSPQNQQEQDALVAQITPLQAQLEVLTAQLKKFQDSKEEAINTVNTSDPVSPIGFLFNLEIGEQVLAGNYTPAIRYTPTPATGTPDDGGSADDDDLGVYFQVPVSSATTDNFGNPLIDSYLYIPVILSVPGPTEANPDMFSNAWTGVMGYNKEQYFTYATKP
jgi:hypothetical protein